MAAHSPPAPVFPEKSVAGTAFRQLNDALPLLAGGPPPSVPEGPRYQDWACVPGTGKRENECSNPGTGNPGDAPPAPLSNSTRIIGSRWNAARAAA